MYNISIMKLTLSTLTAAALALLPLPLCATDRAANLDLARQLNAAFVQVADDVIAFRRRHHRDRKSFRRARV